MANLGGVFRSEDELGIEALAKLRLQKQALLSDLREAAAAPHQLEYSAISGLLHRAIERIEFLESVGGPVSKATAFDNARQARDALATRQE